MGRWGRDGLPVGAVGGQKHGRHCASCQIGSTLLTMSHPTPPQPSPPLILKASAPLPAPPPTERLPALPCRSAPGGGRSHVSAAGRHSPQSRTAGLQQGVGGAEEGRGRLYVGAGVKWGWGGVGGMHGHAGVSKAYAVGLGVAGNRGQVDHACRRVAASAGARSQAGEDAHIPGQPLWPHPHLPSVSV